MASKKMPVIDLQKVDGLGKEIVKACEEWGCFRIVNHGLPADLMSEMKAVVASLHSVPDEIKRRTVSTEPDKGYLERNIAGPFYEALSIDEISSPDEFYDHLGATPHQRLITNKYLKAIGDLARLIAQNLMEGSGFPGGSIEGWCSQLILNKYHFSPDSVGSIGLDMHCDPTFITIIQDDDNVNGLQVAEKDSDEIIAVDPFPGTFVVNIGDIGKAWSNGRFNNVKHRVFSLEPKTRYSILLSVLGPKDKKVETPSQLVDSEHPRLYAPFDWNEYKRVRNFHKLATGGALELFKTTMA